MKIKIYQNAIDIRDIEGENKDNFARIMFSALLGNAPSQEDFDNYYKQVSEVNVNDEDDLAKANDSEICEYNFHVFNMDNRPDGQLFRSMSVGDVVNIDGRVYICCSIGFKKVNLSVDNVKQHENIQHYDNGLLNQVLCN